MRHPLLPLVCAALLGGCTQLSSAPGTDDFAGGQDAASYSSYLSARFAAGQHDYAGAARYYGESLKTNSSDAQLETLAMFYAATSGDMAAAGRDADLVITHTAGDSSARLNLALIALKANDYAGARKQLALSAKGPFATIIVSLFDGWAAAGAGDAAAATADIKTLGAQSGAESIGAFHAALMADLLGQTKAADTAYQKALTAGASPRAIEAYGNFLERSGRAPDAKAFYQKFAGNTALDAVVRPGLDRITTGTVPAPMIRNAQDGAAEGLFSLAAALSDQASADSSIMYLRMALYLRPDMGLAKVLLADRFEDLQLYDQALAIYSGIDKSSPYYRMASVEAAVDQTRLKNSDAAIQDLAGLAAADPGNSETWIALGDAYRDADKPQDAISAYDRAEKALGTPAQKDWPLFYARAMAEDKAKQWDKAEVDINTGLKLSPDEPELLNYLGYSWVDQGRKMDEALALLEKARSLRPGDGYIVDSVGWAYYRLGRYDDAAKTLESAVLLVPGDATINDHLGDAFWKAGRRMDARFQWNHALAFSENSAEKTQIEQKIKAGLPG